VYFTKLETKAFSETHTLLPTREDHRNSDTAYTDGYQEESRTITLRYVAQLLKILDKDST